MCPMGICGQPGSCLGACGWILFGHVGSCLVLSCAPSPPPGASGSLVNIFRPSWRKGRADFTAPLGHGGPVRLSRGMLALGSDTGGDRGAMKAVCARSDSGFARAPRDASTLARKSPSWTNAAPCAAVGFMNDLQNVSNLLWYLPKVSFP